MVTAHVVRALATHGAADGRAIRHGVVWLLRQQQPAGSWPGRGGDSSLTATTTVLPALIVAGVLPAKPPIRSAVDWLLRQQNLDGGWVSVAGAATSQATARAMAALLTAGGAETSNAVHLAADWLVRAQQPDGGWRDETMYGYRSDVGARSGRDPSRADPSRPDPSRPEHGGRGQRARRAKFGPAARCTLAGIAGAPRRAWPVRRGRPRSRRR